MDDGCIHLVRSFRKFSLTACISAGKWSTIQTEFRSVTLAVQLGLHSEFWWQIELLLALFYWWLGGESFTMGGSGGHSRQQEAFETLLPMNGKNCFRTLRICDGLTEGSVVFTP